MQNSCTCTRCEPLSLLINIALILYQFLWLSKVLIAPTSWTNEVELRYLLQKSAGTFCAEQFCCLKIFKIWNFFWNNTKWLNRISPGVFKNLAPDIFYINVWRDIERVFVSWLILCEMNQKEKWCSRYFLHSLFSLLHR